jgi:hypothetical protein
MTFLIARIDTAVAAAITGIANKFSNAIDASLTVIGNKICNAIDASLYHDWDLEETPIDGADPLAEREAEEEVAGTPPTYARKPTPTSRQEARSP